MTNIKHSNNSQWSVYGYYSLSSSLARKLGLSPSGIHVQIKLGFWARIPKWGAKPQRWVTKETESSCGVVKVCNVHLSPTNWSFCWLMCLLNSVRVQSPTIIAGIPHCMSKHVWCCLRLMLIDRCCCWLKMLPKTNWVLNLNLILHFSHLALELDWL